MANFPVASNLENTLTLFKRLPLVQTESNAVTYSTPTLMLVVYVPSRYGGILEVGCAQVGAQVLVEGPAGKTLTDLKGNTIPPAQKFTYPVRPGEYQWFSVLVGNVSGSYQMWATFKEIGLAREGDSDGADPLIPWNFWYYPYDREPELTAWGSSTMNPCGKYEAAFAKTGVLIWEKANHYRPDEPEYSWWGHCHNAAPASMIFKTPPPTGKTVNATSFLCEELKFLATEFFGRKGTLDFAWRLPGSGPIGRSGYFQEHKPSENPKRFGHIIGDFHKKLQDQLLLKRLPLLMDLRDASGTGPSEVWNQAIYKYVAQFWETPSLRDWQDIQVSTSLNANQDTLNADRSSSGVPAKVVPGSLGGGPDAIPDPAASRRDEVLTYHLIFSDDGTIDSTSGKNEWFGVELDDGTDLYAPRFIYAPKKPTGQASPDGNPKIDPTDVLSALELRNRFK